MKAVFTKSYTRDTTLIIQEIWLNALSKGVKEKFNIDHGISPVGIDYIHNGSIEVWESKDAVDFIKKELVSDSVKKTKIFLDFIADYEKALEKFAATWNKPLLTSKKSLIFFIKEVGKYVLGDLLITYLSLQDESGNAVVKKAKELRSKDRYFASNDNVIRKNIAHFYPEIADYITVVRFSEMVEEKLPSIKDCEERFKHFISISGGYCAIETLAEFNRKNPNLIFEEENTEAGKEFVKGEIAFRGLISGKVKVIRLIKELNKIEQGDILVSPMTTPMFTQAMQKAAAFVTDEGGTLSHAAVVARELKKPCVIGTKIATKVLKDGDLVEVDANNGIVKIIKKSSGGLKFDRG
jgi:phosphohistidine swiveling domain-containing protein